MKIVSSFKVLFLLSQLGLAIYFTWNSIQDWNETPAVTTGIHKFSTMCNLQIDYSVFTFSVGVRKVQNETFPAITICYPKSAKWPAIISAASKLHLKDVYVLQNNSTNLVTSIEEIGEIRRSFKLHNDKYYYYVNLYQTIMTLFKDDIELQDFFFWLLAF